MYLLKNMLKNNRQIVNFVGIILIFTIPLFGVAGIGFSRTRITPTQDFFSVTIGGPPSVDINKWNLTIDGDLNNKLTYNYSGFTSLPSTDVLATLQCVEGVSGTAIWHGVRLSYLLNLANIKEDAEKVVFFGMDGYSSSLTVEEANTSNIIIAYKINNDVLPPNQGFPLILVAANQLGYKWVKWIYHIEIVNYDYLGYWESRGWSDSAHYSIFNDWVFHAVLFSIVLIFGGLAYFSGLNLTNKSETFKELPSFMNRKFHIVFSSLFAGLGGFEYIYWIIKTYLERRIIIFSIHGVLSVGSMILLCFAIISGIARYRSTRKLQKYHKRIADYTLIMFLLTIGAGFLLALGIII